MTGSKFRDGDLYKVTIKFIIAASSELQTMEIEELPASALQILYGQIRQDSDIYIELLDSTNSDVIGQIHYLSRHNIVSITADLKH